MSRIQARECLFKLIYEYSFLKEYNELSLQEYTTQEGIDDINKDYIADSYKEIIANYDNIITIIKDNLERYDITRLSKIDLALLVISVYELSIKHNTDYKLEINEAVEMAKKYSNDNSYKFINGVLAHVVNGKNYDK